MNREEDSVVQFLVGLGVFTSDDAQAVQESQVDPIVRRMVEKKALRAAHIGRAKELVTELLSSSNHTKRLKAQMSLMKLVTGKMHDRMLGAGDKIRRTTERITSENFRAVTPVLAKAEGD
jgi:hypothetical protein